MRDSFAECFRGFGRRSGIQALKYKLSTIPPLELRGTRRALPGAEQYAKAREAFDTAIAARGDSPHAFLQSCSMQPCALENLRAQFPILSTWSK